MELNVKATVHLKPADVEEILREYIKKQTGKNVQTIKFNVHSGNDDRFHYSPPSLSGVDIEVTL